MSGKGQLIDAVLQRQAAVSVIVGIQLVKLHQLLSHLGLLEGGGAVAMVTDLSRSSAPPQSSGAAAAAAVTWLTLAQWSLVDGAWLVGLFLVRIPRLRFSLAMTLLLMAGTVCLNAGIIGNLLRHSSSNEATRGADTPRLKNVPKHLLSKDSHIAGSHRVVVVPPTVAKLNPNNTQYCIVTDNTSPAISVPILVKGAGPWLVDYERVNLDGSGSIDTFTNVPLALHSSSSSLSSPAAAKKVNLLHIEFNGLGLYRLVSIRQDTSSSSSSSSDSASPSSSLVLGRIIPSTTSITPCPQVNWIYPSTTTGVGGSTGGSGDDYDSPSKFFDKCVGETLNFQIAARGIPPFKAWYSERISSSSNNNNNNYPKQVSVDIPKPPPTIDSFSAISPSSSSVLSEQDTAWVSDNLPQTVSIPITAQFSYPATYHFMLHSVTDAHGHFVEYGSLSLSSTSVSRPGYSMDIITGHPSRIYFKKPGVAFMVDTHPFPTAEFINCDATTNGGGRSGNYNNNNNNNNIHRIKSGEVARLGISVTGRPPWKIAYQRWETVEAYETAVAASSTNSVGSIGEDEVGGEVLESTHEHEDGSGKVYINADRPGVYLLRGVRDRYCGGDHQDGGDGNLQSMHLLAGTTPCLVQQTIPPSLVVSAEPIEQSCVGAVGTLVNVSVTGEPPFWLEYIQTVRETGASSVVRVDVAKSRHSLVFKPTDPGTYQYEFVKIGDANYNTGISVSDMSITQIIHPQSNARFTSSRPSPFILCTGDVAHVPVTLTGSGPWKLEYEIMFGNQKTRYAVDHIDGSGGGNGNGEYVIATPPLNRGGQYVIGLTEITDGNGCSWPLDSPDISIEVLQQRPAVSFGCSSSDTSIGKPIYFLDGDAARLPISYSGRAPFTLEYKSADGSKIVLENIKPGSSRGSGGGGGGASILEVRQPGSYELLSFRDAHCAGIVVEPRHCSAAIVDKPTISLVGGGGGGEDDDTSSPFVRVAPPICEGTPASIELEFTGKSPFKYQYRREITRTAAVAVTETNDIEEAVGGRVGKINIDTQLAGWFVYTVTKLGDDNYRLFDVIAGGSQDKKKGKIVVKQLVNARPDARILGGPDIVFGCMGEPPLNFDIGGISSRSEEDEAAAGEKDKENVVLIEFKGQAPFDAVLELRHESQQKQVLRLRNITESLYKFTPPTTLSATGKYTLQLVSVVDQTGCGRDFEKEVAAGDAASGALGSTSISTSGKSFGATIINIHVSDVARISPIHAPSGVCIGDMLSYALQGTPPFSILYSYNDVIQPEIVVHDPLISLFAGAAGTLAIKQVCNSAMCCTRPVDLQTVIWDIPKAAIDGGVDVEEDIREGDETVINIDFIGVPPFSFTYSRTPIYAATDNHVDGNPEESYTISGIQESSYTIKTAQEGLFQVTAIYDRYCGYPRVAQNVQGANAIVGIVDDEEAKDFSKMTDL